MFVCRHHFVDEHAKCPVQFIFHFANERRHLLNELIILGGVHNHEGLLPGFNWRFDHRTLRTEIDHLIPFDTTPAKDVVQRLKPMYPEISVKDVYSIRKKHESISLLNYLEVLKESNKNRMEINFTVSTECVSRKPEIKKKYKPRTKKGNYVTVDEMDALFRNAVDCDTPHEVREEEHRELTEMECEEERNGNTVEASVVDSFSLYFPVWNHLEHNTPILFVDGCHHKVYNMVILTIVTVDIDDKVILVAIGGVCAEKKDCWEEFMRPLFQRYKEKEFVIFSDRGEGFIAYMKSIQHECKWNHRFCVFHLFSNFVSYFSNDVCKINWKPIKDDCFDLFVSCATSFDESIINSSKKQLFEKMSSNRMSGTLEMKDIDDWISHNSPEQWMASCLPKGKEARYGYSGTSLAESYNSSILKERELQFVVLLDEIVKKEKRKQEEASIRKGIRKDNAIKHRVDEEYMKALNDNGPCIESSDVYFVQLSTDVRVHTCTINPLQCTCSVPLDEKRPCVHIAKAMKGKNRPASLLPQFYLYQSYNEFHQDQIVVPPLFMIKCDKNEELVFKERAKKYQDRFASTFKDSSCLNKWKKQNDNIERNNSMNIDLDMVRGSK